MGVRVNQWKGAWWLFVHHKGQRRRKRVGPGPQGKKAAELAALKIRARLAEGDTSVLTEAPARPSVTLQNYATQWLASHAQQACKFSTSRIYDVNLRRHVFPILGSLALSALTRSECRQLITACREKGLSRKSIENICRTVSSVLTQAVEDGLITANPAFRLGRYYRTGDAPTQEIRPFTREEASLFLETARQLAPREFPLFL